MKLPVVVRAYRERGWLRPLRDDLVRTRAGAAASRTGSRRSRRRAPTLSRRGLLGLVGGASLTLLLVNVGETVGGPLRRLALLAPRGRVFGGGPERLPGQPDRGGGRGHPGADRQLVAAVGVQRRAGRCRSAASSCWRCRSTPTSCRSRASRAGRRRSTGPGCGSSDLAALVGAPAGAIVHVQSIQPSGPFRHATLSADAAARPARAARAGRQRRRRCRPTTAIRRA